MISIQFIIIKITLNQNIRLLLNLFLIFFLLISSIYGRIMEQWVNVSRIKISIEQLLRRCRLFVVVNKKQCYCELHLSSSVVSQSEVLQYKKESNGYVCMQLLKLKPAEQAQEYVEMTFVEHKSCECR